MRALPVVLIVMAGSAVQGAAQSIFEDIGNAVSHVVNEADKIRRDIQPIDYDFREGRLIVNTGPASIAAQGGEVQVTPGAGVNFVQNLPGQAMCQAMWTAQSNVGQTFPIPADVYSKLRWAGVSEQTLQRVRWSANWNVTLGLPSSDVRAMALDNLVLFRWSGDANDAALWAHELRHVEQYARLGVPTFCTQYTWNSEVFEDEANQEEARVAALLNDQQTAQNQVQQFAYFWVAGQYLYGDAQGWLYPSDPSSGAVLGPAIGRVSLQNGAYVAVDGFGRSFWATRVR